MNTTQRDACETCPPGFYCVDSAIWPVDCPSGEVCSGGTGYDRTLCPQVDFNKFHLNFEQTVLLILVICFLPKHYRTALK